MTHNIFSETRANDRIAMAAKVAALCAEFGIDHEVDMHYDKRATAVQVKAPKGLQLTCDFDGDSLQPNVFVLGWYVHWEHRDTKLNPAAFGHDSVNPFHFRKATDVAYGFFDLQSTLRARFAAIKDGSIYQKD